MTWPYFYVLTPCYRVRTVDYSDTVKRNNSEDHAGPRMNTHLSPTFCILPLDETLPSPPPPPPAS